MEDFSAKEQASPPKRAKAHTDHDYFAHSSPGQGSDSGVSVNSLELEDSYLPSMTSAGDSTECLGGQQALKSSPYPSDSMSPLSDSNSDSNPLALEDFDFSTCMDFENLNSGEGFDLDTIDSGGFSGSKDTDISIDFGKLCVFLLLFKFGYVLVVDCYGLDLDLYTSKQCP